MDMYVFQIEETIKQSITLTTYLVLHTYKSEPSISPISLHMLISKDN